jgi:hypothetical protein
MGTKSIPIPSSPSRRIQATLVQIWALWKVLTGGHYRCRGPRVIQQTPGFHPRPRPAARREIGVSSSPLPRPCLRPCPNFPPRLSAGTGGWVGHIARWAKCLDTPLGSPIYFAYSHENRTGSLLNEPRVALIRPRVGSPWSPGVPAPRDGHRRQARDQYHELPALLTSSLPVPGVEQ